MIAFSYSSCSLLYTCWSCASKYFTCQSNNFLYRVFFQKACWIYNFVRNINSIKYRKSL